jgi:hypothetical protein
MKAPDSKTFFAVEAALIKAVVAALNTANGAPIAYPMGGSAPLPTPRIGVTIPASKPEEQQALGPQGWYHSAYRGHLWLHLITRRDDPPAAGPALTALLGLIRATLLPGRLLINASNLPYHELMWLNEDSGSYAAVAGDETESEPVVYEFILGLPPQNYPSS